MFWSIKPDVKSPEDIQIPMEEYVEENAENTQESQTDSFEEDVMNDLEWFFGNNNGYENVEWEFWFTNPENE